MKEPVKQKVKENRMLFVRIPANMTNVFQLFDLAVIGSFKFLMKRKFTEWYSKEIGHQLDENMPTEKIVVKVESTNSETIACELAYGTIQSPDICSW